MDVTPGCLLIAVETRTELDAALDEAVDLLRPAALTEQVGISVTRLAAGRYEARLNRNIAPGLTVERWAMTSDE